MYYFFKTREHATYYIRYSSHSTNEYKSNKSKCMISRPPHSGPLSAPPSPTRWRQKIGLALGKVWKGTASCCTFLTRKHSDLAFIAVWKRAPHIDTHRHTHIYINRTKLHNNNYYYIYIYIYIYNFVYVYIYTHK